MLRGLKYRYYLPYNGALSIRNILASIARCGHKARRRRRTRRTTRPHPNKKCRHTLTHEVVVGWGDSSARAANAHTHSRTSQHIVSILSGRLFPMIFLKICPTMWASASRVCVCVRACYRTSERFIYICFHPESGVPREQHTSTRLSARTLVLVSVVFFVVVGFGACVCTSCKSIQQRESPVCVRVFTMP